MLTNYSASKAHKLLKRSIPDIQDPYNIKILWVHIQQHSRDEKRVSAKIRHKHSFFEAHFVVNGSVSYVTDTDNYFVNDRNVVIFPPQIHHRRTDQEDDTVVMSIAFMVSAVSPEVSLYRYDENVLGSLDSILKEADNYDELSDSIIKNSVLYSLSDYLRKIRPVKLSLGDCDYIDADSEDDIRVIRAKTFIEDNKGLFLDSNDVARHCHFNVKYLNRIFKSHTGMSLLEYIHDVRTAEAERLLEDDRLSIEQISGALGFINVQYFNTFFKRRTGMSPAKYRKFKFKL